jgi:hypothetical protein
VIFIEIPLHNCFPQISDLIFDTLLWALGCRNPQSINPPKALKEAKVPGNTFELNPKWTRTSPSINYFS